MIEGTAPKPVWLRALNSTWLKIIFAVSVIYALVAFNRVSLHTFDVLADTWGWLVLAFLLMLPPYMIVSYRFWVVLRNQGVNVKLKLAIRWTMIGSFFDIVMPSSAGGDVIKAGYIIRHVGAGWRTRGVMAIGFDRVLGLLGLFFLAGLTSLAGWSITKEIPGSKELMIFLVLVCIGSLLFFRIMGSRRIYNNIRFRRMIDHIPAGSRIYQMIGCFNSLRENQKDIFVVLSLSVLNHVFWCASLLCITVAFSQHVGFLRGFTVFPLAIFSNIFGYAGGFGVGTAAFDFIFSKLLDVQVGAAIGLTFQTLSSASRLLGLPFYLKSGKSMGSG